MNIFDKCERYTRANDMRKTGQYPFFHVLESMQDVEVMMEGTRRIMLGSNNYLGLTSNSEIIQAGVKALEKYGTGCSGSRLLNGTLDLHLELEQELANFLHKEEVITFPTGFQANLGIISCLIGPNEYVICDKENHASIYDGCHLSYGKMLRYQHGDMEDLEKKLILAGNHAKLIVTDGVFSMSGDIARLPEIVALAKKHDARIMVDDAHGLGVLGEGGRGTASYFGLEDEVDIYMGTFSKSLASLGGYVATNHVVADYMRHVSRPFIFSASIQPASCAIALAALRHLEAHPELVTRLAQIVDFAKVCMRKRGLKIMETSVPIVPIYTYTELNTFVKTKEIYDAGVYVNTVIPPATPEGECLIRTSFMATHTEALVEKAVNIIADCLHEKITK